MVQIKRDGGRDFTCTRCGAEISESPARDTGSAACEVCDTIMMKWEDSAILIFRAKKSIEDATRRYLFLGRAAGG
jgi:DNA-directed RNA polymerase subunit RPC12/RpoP